MIGRLSSEEYIRRACELHLHARISTTHKASLDALKLFLHGDPDNPNGETTLESSNSTNPPRLFVWIPQKLNQRLISSSPLDGNVDDDSSGEDDFVEALASTNTFDGTNFGALAFINSSVNLDSSAVNVTSVTALKYSHQIQCMILCPRVFWADDDSGDLEPLDPQIQATKDADDRVTSKEGPNPESITFLSLQMYARHCFVPAVHAIESIEDEKNDGGFIGEGSSTETSIAIASNEKSISTDLGKINREKKKSRLLLEGLEDKLRELDVALGQCRRTTLGQIPQVILRTHPVLTNAASRMPSSGKIDLDELGLSHLLSDDSFLNQVQTGVSTWINQIRKVTGLPTSTAFPSGTNNEEDADDVYMDMEETTFWTNLDLALKHIKSELSKADVQLTIAILKAAKRFVATIALENNTGIDAAEAHVNDVCNFLRPYPVSALIAARDFNKISKVLENIFLHLPKVRQSRFYDLERCVRLLEASTSTFRRRMLFVLKAKGRKSKSHLITGMTFDEYDKEINHPCTQIFERFDSLFHEFTDFIIEQSRKRPGNKTAPIDLVQGIHLHHKILRERLQSLYYFRVQHQKLRSVVIEVLNAEKDSFSLRSGEGGIDFSAEVAIREVEEAPISVFSIIDVLDLSPKGQAAYLAALDGYDRRVDVIEEKLASVLREKLMMCKDAEDMFRVFGRFNPLLSRTRVNNAVKEFQMQLIATVGDSIQRLQSKFSRKFESSTASAVSQIRGIPPISGKILWAKLIERQVRALMKRMGNILGPNWGQHLEGRQLKRSCDELLGKLDARAFLRAWISDWEREMRSDAVSSNARLNSYPIIVVHDSSKNLLIASVNFKESYELLFREIRQLRWLGFDRDIPRTLTSTADEAMARYPLAIALRSTLRSYAAARALVTNEVEPLVFSNIKAIRQSIEEGFGVSIDQGIGNRSALRVRWDSRDIREWIMSLTELVTLFEERVEFLINACDQVYRFIDNIGRLEYSRKDFSESIHKIQKVIDDLSLSSYTNLDIWIDKINEELYVALCARLQGALEAWALSTQSELESQSHSDKNDRNSIFSTIFVDIVLQNQEIIAVPPLPAVRETLLRRFHDFTGAICSLRTIHCDRYEIFKPSDQFDSTKYFSDIMGRISPELITKSYHNIENNMQRASNVVKYWLEFQILWDKSTTDIIALLGDDVLKWQYFLTDLAATRSGLESPETSATVGHLNIRYDKVKAQISFRYDSWQRDLQSAFANILRRRVAELFDELQSARERLESIHLDGISSSTQDVIHGVTHVKDANGKVTYWQTYIEQLITGERVLRRQRYNFPWDWVESSRLKGLFQTIEQILLKRLQAIEDNRSILQTRILTETKVSALRMTDLISTWELEKPTNATGNAYDALETIAKFELGMKKAQKDEDKLIKAKEALSLDSSSRNMIVIECLTELSNLKELWQFLAKSYGFLQEIKDTLWFNGNVRKIRQQLEDIISDMRQYPNRVRLHDAYTYLHDSIKSLVESNALLNDLKTNSLKERHWKSLLNMLNLNVSLQELTFGMLWDSGVLKQKKGIMEILSMAQGEMALEVFLSQVRDRWMKQELDLAVYRNRTRLIKGWDILYTALDEHMGGLALMKNSPYLHSVREFQEESKVWEDRLTKLRGLFDLLMNVQRRYVYLEGIFIETSDIKARLPTEWARFRSVDGEFISLMRRITSQPYALEMLNVENIDRILDRLDTTMNSTQRALGDYLSAQRNDFSRFFFLGDDDLLEILGNSVRTSTSVSHIGKMFAGLGSIKSKMEITVGGSVEYIDTMISKDGEEVTLHDTIMVSKSTSCLEWLRQLEEEMYTTLRNLLKIAVKDVTTTGLDLHHIDGQEAVDLSIPEWINKYPNQIMMLAILINWSSSVSDSLGKSDCKARLNDLLQSINRSLERLSVHTMQNLTMVVRKKIEQLITELVYERDILLGLIAQGVQKADDFRWLSRLRFKYSEETDIEKEHLRISLSHATFSYGFEYLGIGERLVQTPLTDRCYLTLTQALHHRLGGNPFGPAGTGKTETVKALGNQLGRFVVVMNCDERFDFSAIGRIFCGLCQVGAWGCFDEFNRLEERVLSAVSQQILSIQRGLIERRSSIELLGKTINLHENVGIFVTMNPGYAGRRNLPDNLKNLFRSVAMVVPDKRLIAQVLLFSQGFIGANFLAERVVTFFECCERDMSKCCHYDFGLRALKVMLNSAGSLWRRVKNQVDWKVVDANIKTSEVSLIVEALGNNILPKVVNDDVPVFNRILCEVFPGSTIQTSDDKKLKEHLMVTCASKRLVHGQEWIQKVLQLKLVIDMRHGVIVVGSVASGKSSAIRALQEAMEKVDGIRVELYVIEPKVVDKQHLYGELDSTTMEWRDGIFTHIIRTIILNQKGEFDRRHWIVFDGDIDPEWAENLNSVLDDNKILTLPSGERLNIPENVRLIFEVDNLLNATPATVSRCGLIWMGNTAISDEMRLLNLFDCLDPASVAARNGYSQSFLDAVRPMIISSNGTPTLVSDALDFVMNVDHVMTPTRESLLISMGALLSRGLDVLRDYNDGHPDFPMEGNHLVMFARRWLLHSLLWGFAGSCTLSTREKFSDFLSKSANEYLPDKLGANLFDYRVMVENGEYEAWSTSVPRIEFESTNKVSDTDFVVPTTDTTRHIHIIESYVMSRLPLILCGPAGSGKTMTLLSTLQSLEGVIVASLSFSSKTSPDIILKIFRQYCVFKKRGKDLMLEPSESFGHNSWLIIFCDEINLPENDHYGTQRVISFMRQLIEHGGFWREDNTWVRISRIQFVGACNPPSDAGRVIMSPRFLRYAPLIYLDFPSKESLLQIYGTFNGGITRLFPHLKAYTKSLTEAMVDLYLRMQERFTSSNQPHYFFSPRELTRWVRGIYGAVKNLDSLDREDLVRLWAHEALRLFSDRLVEEADKDWCSQTIDEVATSHFIGLNFSEALARPILFSSWLRKDMHSVSKDALTDYIENRLRIFYEEELDVSLVLFDDVIEHMLRIDRVLRQPIGHCLLIGDSGTGKSVLSRFVAWMQGMSVFQIKPHSKYSLEDFNEDLRTVLRKVGVEGEKVCFIFDESNALSGGFLEAMNALLASGEVPGLFEGDNYTTLISACRDSSARDGILAVSEDEIWRRFIHVVQRNLHVIFTMNPGGGEWKNRTRSSPALFNRCVVNWVGTWSPKMLGAVGRQLLSVLDLDESRTTTDGVTTELGRIMMDKISGSFDDISYGTPHHALVAAVVEIHTHCIIVSEQYAQATRSLSRTYISPRDFTAYIKKFMSTLHKVREEFEDQQLHINSGIIKFQQTQDNLAELKHQLNIKSVALSQKELLANQKLQQMVNEQKEAETQRDIAEKIGFEVENQEREINGRKAEAQRQLDEAEPALLSAKSAVNSISKKDLDEIRNLIRPPINVQKTLECIAVMLGEKKVEWADVRKMISRIDFISSILNFDAGLLTSSQIKIVQQEYLDGNDELNYDSVMRSSKACGPLYRWAESQVKYSLVHNRILPLREEVDRLLNEADIVKKKKFMIEVEVQHLEQSIERYKADYADLIRDVQILKSEMDLVATKIKRAENLLASFKTESERWSNIRDGFQDLIQTIVGDSLLMSAFVTYAGFFDFRTRASLMRSWMEILDSVGILYKRDIDMVTSLSSASERLRWQAQGLSSDSLSIENGVILKHHHRFPLVIDPSGHAIIFIMREFMDKRIQRTSFQDSSFVKTLISSIRFGTALVIENIENIDPIIFPVLNREVQRTGGRSLIQVGPEEVDYSPTFTLFLYTKNPATKLTPELCSKVTLVNFTQTPASVQSQCLSLILQRLSPDIEERRKSGLKLYSEKVVRLRELENQMLSSINAVAGNILDDDKMVEGMEILSREGSQLEDQLRSCSDSMGRVEAELQKYEEMACLCRKLFILLLSVREISFLYEFSADYFIRILEKALSLLEVGSGRENDKLENLKKGLLTETAARSLRRMSSEDKTLFCLLLGRLFHGDDYPANFASTDEMRQYLYATLGKDFNYEGRGIMDLAAVTTNDLSCKIPLLICSAPGFDISNRVEHLAADQGKDLAAIAMGSSECFPTAEGMLSMAAKNGSWLLLKNCHLCLEWLQDKFFVKYFSLGNSIHEHFRLFLTSEISPIPISIVRLCDVMVAEAPTGLKASLSRFLSCINPVRFKTAIRNRLYLLVAWLHAVLQERLRYIPSGWSEKYDFTESDIMYALDVIDEFFSHASKGRPHVDPVNLPWLALRTILSKDIYGGRLSRDIDQQRLEDLVNSIFQPEAYDLNFKLGKDDDAPLLPEGNTLNDYWSWIQGLPTKTPPSWIGLNITEEVQLSKTVAVSICSKVQRIEFMLNEQDRG